MEIPTDPRVDEHGDRDALLAALEAALERSHHLQEITARLADARSVADVARAVLVSTRRSLDTLYAGIALVDESRRFLEFQAIDDLPEQTRAEWARVPLSVDAPVTLASRTGRVLFHESTEALLRDHPALAETMALDGQGAFANVPLITNGQTFGVLAISWPAPRRIDEPDRDFILTLASQAAQAIERAQVIERERAAAATLQRAVFPELRGGFDEVQCTGRYVAADVGIDVGGDWYDAFELSDGSLLFAIGDVAGHGLAAATTMVQLRNMLRAYAFVVMEPATVLERLDTILGETGSDQFATCFVARFDPTTRVLTSASAGHPAPIVVVPDRPADQLTVVPAPLLGARGEQLQSRTWMPPGTRMLCFTDGLVERRSTPIDEGVARVLATVEEVRDAPLEAVCDRLLHATADAERGDDVCLLGIDFGRGRRLRFPGQRRRGRRG